MPRLPRRRRRIHVYPVSNLHQGCRRRALRFSAFAVFCPRRCCATLSAAAAALLEAGPNVVPFRPGGKSRMREWVQINAADLQDYRRYLPTV